MPGSLTPIQPDPVERQQTARQGTDPARSAADPGFFNSPQFHLAQNAIHQPPTPPSASALAPSCGESGTPPRCKPRGRNSTAWSPPTRGTADRLAPGSKASPSLPCRSSTGGACVPPTPSSGRSSRRSNAAPVRSASSQPRCPAPPRYRSPRRNRRGLGNLGPHLHQLAQPECLTAPLRKSRDFRLLNPDLRSIVDNYVAGETMADF
jgi:hypothetical protein